VLGNRVELARRLFQRKEGSFFDLIEFKLFGPVLINGLTLTDVIMPEGVAKEIEETRIPLKVIATDFYRRSQMAITAGPLRTAVAASIAIPGFISAPLLGDRVLIDGAISNPVPFNHVQEGCDIAVAIDVTGGPVSRGIRPPANIELAFGASQILMRHISGLMRERSPPDIYIEPDIDRFRVLEFFRIREILEAAESAKQELKRQLEQLSQVGVRRLGA
jgi:NTE family protein